MNTSNWIFVPMKMIPPIYSRNISKLLRILRAGSQLINLTIMSRVSKLLDHKIMDVSDSESRRRPSWKLGGYLAGLGTLFHPQFWSLMEARKQPHQEHILSPGLVSLMSTEWKQNFEDKAIPHARNIIFHRSHRGWILTHALDCAQNRSFLPTFIQE